jgi:hypothetical protein
MRRQIRTSKSIDRQRALTGANRTAAGTPPRVRAVLRYNALLGPDRSRLTPPITVAHQGWFGGRLNPVNLPLRLFGSLPAPRLRLARECPF